MRVSTCDILNVARHSSGNISACYIDLSAIALSRDRRKVCKERNRYDALHLDQNLRRYDKVDNARRIVAKDYPSQSRVPDFWQYCFHLYA